MLLRSILSSLLKNEGFPSIWVCRNGVTTLASAENSFSPSVSGEETLQKGYVLSYLLNSCGLSPEKAISASKFVQFDAPDKPIAVLKFLEKQGFTRSQIANLVAKFPAVLVYDPQMSLSPKFEFLRSTGISELEIPTIVSRYPDLLTRSFKRRVAPVYNYIKGIIGAANANTLLRRGSWIFNLDIESRIVPNVDLLREVGVPQDRVELKRVADEVKQLGFDPLKSTFILAINARKGEGSVWDKCNGVYSKWGWWEDDIRMAFKKHPSCMLLSEKKISAAMDFLVNKIGRESRVIAKSPQVLFYSLKERIVPRCSVVRLWLRKIGT
ncbi:uncharacterized protein LOC130997995 [Salvia miltiorrhiza]|uniref:uncharacterized protein LOC130997995 n=1 Tax=Salvia miltiorrhiza TaxID=226208 RepID=UPI0025AC020F|nr:uncharacterized protein LOC130997995 [Salvia miltiorrhiza]